MRQDPRELSDASVNRAAIGADQAWLKHRNLVRLTVNRCFLKLIITHPSPGSWASSQSEPGETAY
jgi:hypothetical protein